RTIVGNFLYARVMARAASAGGGVVAAITSGRTDAEVGLGLDPAQVEELRQVVAWIRGHRGSRLKDIARAIDQPEHSLSNFIRGRSKRPGNQFLGRLCGYFAAHPELLPDHSSFGRSEKSGRASSGTLGILARYGLVSLDVPISVDDVRRVYERYTGYYLCHGVLRANHQAMICSLLHIRPARRGAAYDAPDLPLARFTFMVRVPDSISPRAAKRYVVVGYAISRNGKLFLTGHHDGELQYLVLREPRERRFQFVEGYLLTTLVGAGSPAPMRMVCERLAAEGDRKEWGRLARTYAPAAYRRAFQHADTIMAALSRPFP
ncbi:MAG: hypothetical protein ACREER_11415, partial [Alphaproteobacteria bacterium]